MIALPAMSDGSSSVDTSWLASIMGGAPGVSNSIVKQTSSASSLASNLFGASSPRNFDVDDYLAGQPSDGHYPVRGRRDFSLPAQEAMPQYCHSEERRCCGVETG